MAGLLVSAPLAGCGADLCGNGAVDPGELCDDGNDEPHDACNNLCTTPSAVGWTYIEASPIHAEIHANALAIGADGEVYVAGAVVTEEVLDFHGDLQRKAFVRRLSVAGAPDWLMTSERGGRIGGIATTRSGDPLVAGVLEYPSTRGWIQRLSPEGVEQWTINGEQTTDDRQAIVRLADDTFAVAGTTYGVIRVQRVDGDGALLNGAGIEARPYAPFADLVATGDRLFAVGPDTSQSGLTTITVAAFTTQLEPLWATISEVEGSADRVTTLEGDLLVAGRFEYLEGYVEPRAWIRRLSGDDGAVLWHIDLDLERGQRVYDLASDHQGAFVVAGSYAQPSQTAWIAKLDGAGQTIWSVEEALGDTQPRGGSVRARAVEIADDDRIYVAGDAIDDLGYARIWVQERQP